VELVRKSVLTFVPGQTYAQELEYPHFVETNAETGHTNGDVCSTIYIHGPGLTDAAGRRLPLLLERERVPDSTVAQIPSMNPEQLESSLRRYRSLLQESLSFYDWLYHPKYGRNLSVGLVAGYFLSEAFGTVRTVEMWERHRQACVEVLRAREERLLRLIRREESLDALTERDRTARYFQQLINKSWEHPEGQRAWFAQYGDLTKEFERYLGALVGDYARDPDIKVLKPIWNMGTTNLQGGAHYGHIWAMLEAVRKVEPRVLGHFRAADFNVDDTSEGPVTEVDRQAQADIRQVLVEHFPGTAFVGEEGRGRADGGARRRWLVDPIDGTRNFLHGNKNFALSLAHQQLAKDAGDAGDAWTTTDAVVSLPAHAEVFWAERGQGAWHIDSRGVERRMRVRRTSGDALKGRLIDLSVRGLGLEAELKLTELLMRRGAVRRATGSAAMMLCMVGGCGNSGAMVTANDYDVAAGLLVAREAGATVSELTFEREGRRFTAYLAGESEATHAALRSLLDEVLASSGSKGAAAG
jgi:fructose-1,6-bisphosphatase/inositol monophosphatase family enzyme